MVWFTGGLHYTKEGHLYREIIEGEPQYVGAPTPEIDAAWDQLLKGRLEPWGLGTRLVVANVKLPGQYINLVGEDAATMVGRTWQDELGQYEVAFVSIPPTPIAFPA